MSVSLPPEDVRFDHGAATAGVAACARASAALDEVRAQLDAAVVAAVQEWVGPHRRAFDTALAQLRATLDEAHDAVGVVRRHIADGVELATRDQLARQAARLEARRDAPWPVRGVG